MAGHRRRRRSRVEFGPLVACTNFHNPALLAKQAATIDEISGGRFILGLGAGWNETEFRAFGFPFDHRVDRFEEAFTIIRTLLQRGRHRLRRALLPGPRLRAAAARPRPGGPPLLIGSNGPRMLRIDDAARRGLEHVVRRHRQRARLASRALRDDRRRRLRDVGRDPAEIERTVAVHVRLPGGTGRIQGDYAKAAAAPPLEGHARGRWRRACGPTRARASAHVQLVLDPITRGSIEAFAPVLRARRLTDVG